MYLTTACQYIIISLDWVVHYILTRLARERSISICSPPEMTAIATYATERALIVADRRLLVSRNGGQNGVGTPFDNNRRKGTTMGPQWGTLYIYREKGTKRGTKKQTI